MDGVKGGAIRYGKKAPNRLDLMLKPIRVESCDTPLSEVYQYQYTGHVSGLGYAYVFWFNDCRPAGSPYKVVVRRADDPLPPNLGGPSFTSSTIASSGSSS
jgi:hypothetical protein